MRRRAKRAEIDLGYAGLAILRSFPWGDQSRVVREMAQKLETEDWDDYELEIEEFETESGYASWAATYDSLPNPLIDLEETIVRAMIDGREPGFAVDAACGTGRYSEYLLKRGFKVVAIDSSEAMLRKARERLSEAEVKRGDLRQLPVPDAVADVALCALALTHFENLEEPLGELSRVVKPGGRVIISDVHPVDVATSAHAFFRTEEGSRGVIRNYVHWPSDYIAAFRQSNLTVVDCAEPKVNQASIETINPPASTRRWVEEALLGLPFALIWELGRTS